MRKILIATHGNMGKGMVNTIEYLSSLHHMYAIDAYTSNISLEEQIDNFFSTITKEDVVVILTDMQGGSVNQKLCEYMDYKTHLICGVNLPLALTIALYPQDQEITEHMIEAWLEEAKNQMIYMNTYQNVYSGDDE